jgi:hypothetical protein
VFFHGYDEVFVDNDKGKDYIRHPYKMRQDLIKKYHINNGDLIISNFEEVKEK